MRLKRHHETPRATTGRQRAPSTRSTPPAFSYHTQRAPQQVSGARQSPGTTPVARPAAFDFWLKRSGFIIGTIVIIGCLISVLSLSSSPRLIDLDHTPSAFLQPQSVYQQAASRALGRSILNRNKITVNTASVATSLRQQFPELSSVVIALPLIDHRPIIYIQAAQPAFLYAAHGGTYVLDDSGKALAKVTSNTPKLTLSTVTDQTDQAVTVGKTVLTTNNVLFIKTVVADLAARQVTVTALRLPASAAEELDVQLNGVGYYAKFNMHDGGGARQQAGTLLAVQAKLKSENVVPAQYIDVRVPGRAYYL